MYNDGKTLEAYECFLESTTVCLHVQQQQTTICNVHVGFSL